MSSAPQTCAGHLDPDGLGLRPGRQRPVAGMLGMHGTRTANYAMDEADLIIAMVALR